MIGKDLLVITQSDKFPAIDEISFKEANKDAIGQWIDNK
jgi:hypothetical protein